MPGVLRNFRTYPQDKFALHLNLYDGSRPDADSGWALALGGSVNVTHVEGAVKQVLWKAIGDGYASRFGYVWFLDDDMEFGLHVFPFYQFFGCVRRLRVLLAAPALSQPSATPCRRTPVALDKHVTILDFVEQNSMLFRSDVWQAFNRKVVTPAEDGYRGGADEKRNDWGVDTVACEAMYHERRLRDLDAIPCAKIAAYFLPHLNANTLDRAKHFVQNRNGTAHPSVQDNVERYTRALQAAYYTGRGRPLRHNVRWPGFRRHVALWEMEEAATPAFRARLMAEYRDIQDGRRRARNKTR